MKIEHTSDLLHSVLCDCWGQLTLFLVTTLSNIKTIYLHQTTLQGPVISAVQTVLLGTMGCCHSIYYMEGHGATVKTWFKVEV